MRQVIEVNSHLGGFRCWAKSHRGLVRLRNEDAFALSATTDVCEQWAGQLATMDSWAVIADGMGGHAAGHVASRIAVESLRDASSLLFEEEGIEDMVAALHDSMFSAMRRNSALAGMGTTIAGVALGPINTLCFNVGDSRIYHWGSTLSLISEDHVIGGHVLTRCIGGVNEHEAPEPALVRIEWKKGQRLLLCTDGLTDMLDDDEIADLLSNVHESPADALVNAALDAGGRDNVTVVILEKLV